jgi:aminoacylase
MQVTAHGNTGHGSRFIESTAVEHLLPFAQRALAFRAEQRAILHGEGGGACGCSHAVAKKVLGDVTSLNLTVLRAGTEAAINVIPSVAEAIFDIRISPHVEPSTISKQIDIWCHECSPATTLQRGDSFNIETRPADSMEGPRLQWEYVKNRMQQHHTTSTDATANPWWPVFVGGLGPSAAVEPLVFPAATDSRFLRAVGIRALGFSPMRRSPVLLHEHNEYLDETVFLEGCSVYCDLLKSLASQGKFVADTTF